ncbi:uncharacterized protein KY384_008979 [Bacidia gigantensis]|uniref:uncharacterized protein n=1 Tax=Bacidia gigantensis TaxID=2732470 RepID=UPI001D042DE6|nr:uncharacterized protein KY384_008979 [Bacidia gigantensis]KAG8525335.1 hypothetical protein KY384_008979 [Bacidia gigantensis]
MATSLPPPSKRQKIVIAEKEQATKEASAIPENLGSVRVQFVDQATGHATGAPISVPVASATVKNLELLLNTVKGHNASDRIPYRFTYLSAKQESSAIDVINDLYHSVLEPGIISTEESIRLFHTPQAVFKVRAVSRCSSSIPGHGEPILAAAFSPASSSRLVTGSGDKTARIWDCDTGTPFKSLQGHTGWVLAVSWSPDNTIIATGSMDNTVRLWDPISGQPLGQPLRGHTKCVTALAWEPYHLQAPGRPRIASSSKDSTVRIWDVVGRRIENVLSGHRDHVSCVRWGGTGRVYTSSRDKTIKIWDPSQGTLVQTLSKHSHWVNHLALSTDFVLRTAFHDHTGDVPSTQEGKISKANDRFQKAAQNGNTTVERLVSASDDFTIYLWEPAKSKEPISRLLGHQKQVNHVTFSYDGHYIASSGFDNHVKLWNGSDGKFIASLRGHVGPVYMSCFSADSRLLVSCSKDTTLKVWDMGTKKLKEDLPGHRDEVYAVDWSADGAKVGSGGKDKQVRLWSH